MRYEARQVMQVENRGGDRVDWKNAVAGEPLPSLGEEYPEPESLPGEELPGASDPEAQ